MGEVRASTPVIDTGRVAVMDMSRSEININSNGHTGDLTRSGIDHTKRYTINGYLPEQSSNNATNMKKPSTNLKYAPPTLAYQPSLKSTIQPNTVGAKTSSNLQDSNVLGQNSNISQKNGNPI